MVFLDFYFNKSVKKRCCSCYCSFKVDKAGCSQRKVLCVKWLLLEAQVHFMLTSGILRRVGDFQEEIEAILRKLLTNMSGLTF